MIRLLKPTIFRILLLLLLFVVLSAFLIVAGRVLVSAIPGLRGEVEQWAEEALGQSVQIGEIEANWRGFGPRLVLRDVALLDPETRRPGLSLAEIRVDYGLTDALKSESARPRHIGLVGARLSLRRHLDGSVSVAGLKPFTSSSSSGGTRLLPWKVTLTDSELFWEDEKSEALPLHFENVAARLVKDRDRYQLTADIPLPGGKGVLSVAADIRGQLDRPESWRGDLYLKGERVGIARLAAGWLPKGHNLKSGEGDWELWGHIETGVPAKIEGRTAWRKLHLESEGATVIAEEAAGNLRWQRQDSGWRLDVGDFRFRGKEGAWPRSGFSLVAGKDEQGWRKLEAGFDYLRLQDLLSTLGFLPFLPESLKETLEVMRPQGELHRLQVRYEEGGDSPSWTLSGEVLALETEPWQRVPGIKGLSARFWGNRESAAFDIDSRELTLEFPRLFREPLELERFAGRVEWLRGLAGGGSIRSRELVAYNRDVQTRTRLHMAFSPDPEISPFLDLQTDFWDGVASKAYRYLPVGIMREKLVQWLDRSLVSGKVTSGSCLFRGHLRDFAFHESQAGRFEVLFGVENMVLDYWPGWPRLEEAVAEVRFLNDGFDTWIQQGKILDSELSHTHGRIRRLSKGAPFELEGTVSGPLSDELRLLRESPLAEKFGQMAAELEAEGEAKLRVNFAIPLKQGKPPFRLDGQLSFLSSTLHLKDWRLPIEALRGDLFFSHERAWAKGVKGQALEAAITLDVGRPPAQPDVTRISAAGVIAGSALESQFPGMGLKLLQGSAPWSLALDIAHAKGGKEETRLSVESGLEGVTIPLPAPVGKKAKKQKLLRLATVFGGGDTQSVKVRLGDILDAAVLVEVEEPGRLKLARGELVLGGEEARLPESGGLRLRAVLDELNIGSWLNLTQGGKGGLTPPLPKWVEMDIGSLELAGNELKDLKLRVEKGDSAWEGSLSSDSFSGSIAVPDDPQTTPIVLDFDQLALELGADGEEGESPPVHEKIRLDPREFPLLDLKSRQLFINGRDYGDLELKLRHGPGGLVLQPVSLQSGKTVLGLEGNWQIAGSAQRTNLKVDLTSPDLGQLLTETGFTQKLEGAGGSVNGLLSWVGGPADFDMGGVAGKVTLNIGQGRLLEVDPGLGRILALLNVTSLQRRLTLDFSDIYKKGFSFDAIEGSLGLEEGIATANLVRIQGPAAAIEVSGHTDLVNEKFDVLWVAVTPEVSSTLPLAGAIAGGPAVGAALYLAQRFVGNEVDRIGRLHYRVNGPWDDPEITRIRGDALQPVAEEEELLPIGSAGESGLEHFGAGQ